LILTTGPGKEKFLKKTDKMRFGIDKVVKTLIISDFLLQGGWAFIGPIFVVLLSKQIQGGSIEMVGFIVALYWITKSIFQAFIVDILKIQKGEKDDFNFLIKGLFVANLVPLGYFFANQIIHIFILELIRAIAMACVIPSWSAIFSRHLDNHWADFYWNIENTAVGLATGFGAFFGGIIAAIFGFKILFVFVSTFGLIATFLLRSIKGQLFLSDKGFFNQNSLKNNKKSSGI